MSRLLCAVMLALASAVAGAVPARASVAGGAPAAASPTVEHVVIVGVGGLRFTDVSANTPALARLARVGSVGALSVRAAPAPPRVTCPAEGWLTVGAGTYAAVLDPTGTDTATGCAGRHPTPVVAGAVSGWARIQRLNAGLRFGARPGLLGGTLPCAVAVGQGAALATADPTGHVDTYAERLPDPGPVPPGPRSAGSEASASSTDPGALLRRCPLTAVDLGSLPPAGPARAEALAAVDAQLSIVDAHRPARTVVAVLGLADSGEDGPHLHLAALAGPGFDGGWLRSASTRRTPYVQLSDVAPTALRLLGVRVPGGLAGAPMAGGADGRPSTMDATAAALADADRAATSQRESLPLFILVLGALWILVLLTRWTPPFLALAAVPGCTFLANLVPWWRSPWPAVAATVLVLGLATAVAWSAYAGPWRRHAVLLVAGFTAAVLTLDGLTGTTLQINSLLGYNPLVAGRFTGFGNLAFAVYGAAGLLFAALLAHRFRSPRAGVAAVLTTGTVLVVVDGLPAWGADVGGVLTLVPALTVLALLAGRARVSAARLAAAGLGAATTAAAIGVADHQRAPDQRSHFGRFVAGVLDGTAGATLERKLAANLDLLVAGPHTWAALALVLIVTWCVARPPARIAATFVAVPGLRPAVVAVAVLGWLGFATNDSGVAVPLLAALVAVPAVLAARTVRAAPNGATPRLMLHDR